MNIQINRDTLLKPLSAVTGIVERRHTLPILSNLLLEAQQDRLVLTATDLEMQISLAIDTAGGGELATTISAKKRLRKVLYRSKRVKAVSICIRCLRLITR